VKAECKIGDYANEMQENLNSEIRIVLDRFTAWLERYGELSYDQYDLWASSLGQRSKAFYYRNPRVGAIAVAPFVFLDAFLPSVRRWFCIRKRFPIADAHFAMGFAFLFKATGETNYYQKAVHFLNILINTRCPGYEHYGWGYPFDWATNNGTSKKNTPLITTTPYVYEAFNSVYEIDGNKKWLEIMRSIAEHVANDYYDIEIKKGVCVCSYGAKKQSDLDRVRYIINANAYRAFTLADAAYRFSNSAYWETAQRNLNFVLESQESDGSWFYAADGTDSFVDHFHTCFVLKNLIKFERLTGNKGCHDAIKRGIEFYIKYLIDENRLPKPFAKTQRMTLYRRELYDYAESINLALLQLENYREFNKILNLQLSDLLSRWQKPDGSFRTRQLFLGWNNVPYHRWAQAQLFRSLCFWLLQGK
jgi:hypothetical protein